MKVFIRICLIIFAVLFWNDARVVFAQEQKPPAKQIQETQPQEAQKGPTQAEVASATVAQIIQIKPLEGKENIYSFELRNVEIGDLFRVLAHDYKINLLVDKDIQGQVTASLSNVTLEEALSAIAESQNLILEKKGNIIKVINQKMNTRVFKMKYLKAGDVLGIAEVTSTTSQSAGTTGTTSTSGTTPATK